MSSGGGGGSAGGGASQGGSAGTAGNDGAAPSGLLTELLARPDQTALTDSTPEFSWVVPSNVPGDLQTAYRILVASDEATLETDTGDVWDSGKTASNQSSNVPFAGSALAAGGRYTWKVQTWGVDDEPSLWSVPQTFVMSGNLNGYSTPTEPVALDRIAPTSIRRIADGHYFVDFGRAVFGWVELTLDSATAGAQVNFALGEKLNGDRLDTNPGGTIRYAQGSVTLEQGPQTYRVNTPAVERNTTGDAIRLPRELGVVMPFRYVEVSNAPVEITEDMLRQVYIHYPFDPNASSFSSSDETLNQVMDISRYSIIATTFAGVYVDGDRERIPYEGDAYIQQLGHYAVDRDFALARYSHEYLLENPTWPTEWKQHSIFMAWQDWMYTGNTDSLEEWYDLLTREKTLEANVDSDGLLVSSNQADDLVDWPEAERDGFDFTNRNAVVNAFWCLNLRQMAEMATAIGRTADATRYSEMAETAVASFNRLFFNAQTGRYVDGVGSSHSSIHANLFPLAFDLVPDDRKESVLSFVKSKGMACSVYAAQYLLEALYRAGDPEAAFALMTATDDRSWMNMIRVGSTITLEAWDIRYKSNLDWNHAWGAAPANVVPRYLFGVRPLEPGFAKVILQPQMAPLTHAETVVPTIRGPISITLDHPAGQAFTMNFDLPANMTANVALPSPCTPMLDGVAPTVAMRDGISWVDDVPSGSHDLVCN